MNEDKWNVGEPTERSTPTQQVFEKVIDEVRQVTAQAVAKKQDAAKLNYPNIISKIKAQAALGNSFCILTQSEMNEYDKKLLEQDGFTVRLQDKERIGLDDYRAVAQFNPDKKEWRITW